MDFITDIMSEVILSVLGVVLTYLAARLGKIFGAWYEEKFQNETLRSVAKTCVLAVEQMYRDAGGKEKLEKALLMGEAMLQEKRIKIEAEELRVLLEAALSEMKGAFEKR